MSNIRSRDPGPRKRIFAAIHDTTLRNYIKAKLQDPQFEVKMALQKQSIVDEPRFFSPDIVFIEDKLVIDINHDRFVQLLNTIGPTVPVVVFGRKVSRQDIAKLFPDRKILVLPQPPRNLTEALLTRYLPPSARRALVSDDDAAHIISTDKYSFAHASVPARVTRIHPLFLQISVPYPIADFALMRIDAPILKKAIGRSTLVKVTDSFKEARHDMSPYVHKLECYFADVNLRDRKAMSEAFTALLNDQMAQYQGESLKLPADSQIDIQPDIPNYTIEDEKPIKIYKPPELKAGFGQPVPKKIFEKKPRDQSSALYDAFADAGNSITVWMRRTNVKAFFTFASFTMFVSGLLWLSLNFIAPAWKKSGKQYNDSLKKFAPSRFEQPKEGDKK